MGQALQGDVHRRAFYSHGYREIGGKEVRKKKQNGLGSNRSQRG